MISRCEEKNGEVYFTGKVSEKMLKATDFFESEFKTEMKKNFEKMTEEVKSIIIKTPNFE